MNFILNHNLYKIKMSALALELLSQLPVKIDEKIKQKLEEKDKLEEEIFKMLPEPNYTKNQMKQIRKQEVEVAKLILEIQDLPAIDGIMKTYRDVTSKPLILRYVVVGSSVEVHKGYQGFINCLKKLVLFNKVKHSERLRNCIKV
jgi:hypothetical protein